MTTCASDFTFPKSILRVALGVLALLLPLPLCVHGQPCVPPPLGLVSWWQAESNTLDNVDGNDGNLIGNVTYAPGRVGQAFSFDGANSYVDIPSSGNINFSGNMPMTIETWVYRTGSATTMHIVGKRNGCQSMQYQLGFDVANGLFFSSDGILVGTHWQLPMNTWQHLAATFDGTTVVFFIDGQAVASGAGSLGAVLTAPLRIGRAGDCEVFAGLIDEVSIYNRALSTNEIQAIYNAGNSGKCALLPAIAAQPASQTVPAGTNVTFTVAATGSKPLSYQWQFNVTNIIVGGTNASLTLTNVQPATNGNYTVVVSNSINSITSAPANLIVLYAYVFGNGQNLANTQYTFIGSVNLQLQTFFINGTMFYTLDGSAPGFASMPYTGPFVVNQSSILRVITYSVDFFQSWETDPITLLIIPTYSLTATTPGGGAVAVTPTNGPYVSNTVINVTATPASGWTFLNWLGDASGSNPVIALTMNRNKSVQALFGTSLSTTVAGNGSVTFFPPGGFYPFGTVVQLLAVPQSGKYFGAWGNAGNDSSNPLNFTLINANPTVSSVFGSLGAGEFTLTVIPNGLGQVTVNPQANRYNGGDNVTLTPAPDAGQQFIDWSGDASGTNSPLIVVMNPSKTITANFTRRPRLSVLSGLDALNEQGFRLTLTGEYGGHYRIDASTNLLDWTGLVTFSNTYGSTQFTDESATNFPRQFYKAVAVP